jgi:hypothetical protein
MAFIYCSKTTVSVKTIISLVLCIWATETTVSCMFHRESVGHNMFAVKN